MPSSRGCSAFSHCPHGIPAHDTVARVFARLAPEAFRTYLLAWLSQVQERRGAPLARQLVATDGKAARHSFDRAIDRSPLHLVRAWATASHVVLGQIAGEQTSNEITAIPTLLQWRELSGGIVTIDAMGTQKEIAKTIIAQDADDVLALKGNQGTLHEDVARFFAWADPEQDRGLVHQAYETHHTGHGREERRRTTVPNDSAWRRGDEDWTGWQTRARVEAWRTQGDAVAYERRYSIRSLGVDAKRMAERGRGRWAIESSLPWGLDLAFHEDDRRIRKGHAPETVSLLRHLALNLLKQEKTSRHGVKGKRTRAGWDNDYLLTVLGI